MVTEQDIRRINELYHKSKEGSGLTEEEKAEQATLRRAYIEKFINIHRVGRNNFCF